MVAVLETFSCGHPRTADNTYTRKDGSRPICKICTRVASKDYRDRKKSGELKPNYLASRTHCANGHEFTTANTHINRRGHRVCRLCRREYMSGWHGYLRTWQLKTRFRITSKEYSDMLVAQDGLCIICLQVPATQVDHDHKTGRVRGLLCGNCNKGLGLFKDDTDALRFAAEYLEGS